MTPITDINSSDSCALTPLNPPASGGKNSSLSCSLLSPAFRDYMTFQDEFFKDLTIDELYEQAKQYQQQKSIMATSRPAD